MTSTSIEYIPLKNLVLWDGNVRKTAGAKEGIGELAASIKARGLINPLAVRSKPGRQGTYEIGAAADATQLCCFSPRTATSMPIFRYAAMSTAAAMTMFSLRSA